MKKKLQIAVCLKGSRVVIYRCNQSLLSKKKNRVSDTHGFLYFIFFILLFEIIVKFNMYNERTMSLWNISWHFSENLKYNNAYIYIILYKV